MIPTTVSLLMLLSACARQPTSGSGATCCSLPGRAALMPHAALAMRVQAPEAPASAGEAQTAGPPGMVWVPGGEFRMGSTDRLARPDESPVHRVRVDGFWMDATEVTNAEFDRFVRATGYKTTAERPVDWEELKKQLEPGTPKPDESMLQPGSLVFTPPKHPVNLADVSQWWSWTNGADWRHPGGPGTSIEGKANDPVVQVSWLDAVAYAKWAGKSLPTEAQWERAARGGLDGKVNVWGDEPVDPKRCNTWQGHFPEQNTQEDGFVRAAPVKSFPPNGYGLYEMAGNVWEWCDDLYQPDTYAKRVAAGGADHVAVNPRGPANSQDPRNMFAPELRVQRGGSFLCSDQYCASYRPSARMACAPDTGSQHVGFRCVMTAEQWEAKRGVKPPEAGASR